LYSEKVKGESVKIVRPTELRKNQKELLDLAYQGEILLMVRPRNENLVILSEEEYNRLIKIEKADEA
jgi:antitoxin YefM